MATITANTGANAWNTNGAWVGNVQPTSADDVIIPASAVVTVPSTGVAPYTPCRSLTVQASGTLIFAAGSPYLTIGDAVAGVGNVAVSFDAASTITQTGAGAFFFASTAAVTHTITSGGQIMPQPVFQGVGATYQLTDAYSCIGIGELMNGTLDTNSQAVSFTAFYLDQSVATRVLTLGSSAWTLSAPQGLQATVTTGLTITPNTATFTITGTSSGVTAGVGGVVDLKGASLALTGPGQAQIIGSWTFANLTRTGTAVATDTFALTSGTTTTVTGNLNISGNSTSNRLTMLTSSRGTAATVSVAGTSTLANIDFKDITASGAGGTWSGTSLGNAGGNTNITFTTAGIRYAVVAGNTSSTATWSATSGGAGGASLPLPQDAVVFDALSAAGTYVQDLTGLGTGIDFTGFTRTFSQSVAWETYGSVTLASGMTISGTGALTLAGNGSNTFTTAGKSWSNTLTISAGTGTYTLGDNFTSTGAIGLSTGTLNTGNKTISATSFTAAGISSSTLTLGSSAITLTGTANSLVLSRDGANLTITANTAIFTLTGASASINVANMSGASIVASGSGSFVISSNGTPICGNFTRSGTAVKTDSLSIPTTAGLTCTGTFTVTGQSLINRVLVFSSTRGTAATVTVAGLTTLTNADIMDITAAGAGGTWSGTSLGDCQGNSNITFTTPATQTFASGTKNWSDVTAWTSRVPLPQDDVIINTTTLSTLTTDMPTLGHNINFTSYTRTLSTTGGAANLSVFGNLTLSGSMTITGSGVAQWLMVGRGAQTITSNGKSISFGANNKGMDIHAITGSYTLQDNFNGTNGSTAGFFRLLSGTLNLNGFTLGVSHFNTSTTTWPRTLTMSGGLVAVTATDTGTKWNAASGNLTFTTPPNISATVATASAWSFVGGGMTYGTLTYTVAGSTGAMTLSDGNTFGTINFSDATNARTIKFGDATTTTILTAFNVVGTAGKLMTITSAFGTPHILSKSSGIVSTDYLSISQSHADGGASWFAGTHSTDGGGNTGWNFIAPPVSDANMLEMF